jgi:hypothetical protein
VLAGVVRTLICGDAERGGYAMVADSRAIAIGERQPNRGVALVLGLAQMGQVSWRQAASQNIHS